MRIYIVNEYIKLYHTQLLLHRNRLKEVEAIR